MADEWLNHPERFALGNISADEYIDLIVDIIRHLDPSIAIERFASLAPRHLLLHSPLGGVRIDTLRELIIQHMSTLGATQGDLTK